MSKIIGKIIPGFFSFLTGIYVLYVFKNIIDPAAILIAGFMCFWGISTAYYPLLDTLDEFKDYVHNYAAKKLGVEP